VVMAWPDFQRKCTLQYAVSTSGDRRMRGSSPSDGCMNLNTAEKTPMMRKEETKNIMDGIA